MSRFLLTAATILLLSGGQARGEENRKTDPSAPLVNRSYCAAELGDGRLAAGTTYGVLFYQIGDLTGTAEAPQRLEPESRKLLLPDSVNDLAFANGVLVVANGPSGVKLVRGVGPEEELTLVSTINTPGAAMSVAISGRYLVAAMGVMGVGLYDIDDPKSPRLLGVFETKGYARQARFVSVESDDVLALLIANGRGGLVRLTIDPLAENPVIQSERTEQSGDIRQVLPVPGGLAVSRGKQGVCLLPHVSRKAPEHCFDNLDVVRGLALAEDKLLAGDGGEGIMVVSGVDDWEPGQSIRYKLSQGSINRLYVFDDTVVCAADYFGILVFPTSSL